MSETSDPTPEAPTITITGQPTEDELGAVMTLLAAALAPRPNPRPARDRPQVGGWNSLYRAVRREHRAGPGAWTAKV